ncbi:transposase, partial [Burkholderia singularis]|uniref:transposase n=1 Tax=Burkholderia singularis TaxID=1503053 RepID=UPI001FDF21DD
MSVSQGWRQGTCDAPSDRYVYSVEQIVAALKQAELGMPVADLVRQLGISEQTYYRWKKQYAGLESNQVRELKQLQDENERLKKLVAELSLDKAILQDIATKMYGPPRLCKASVVDPTHVSLRKCI